MDDGNWYLRLAFLDDKYNYVIDFYVSLCLLSHSSWLGGNFLSGIIFLKVKN